MALAGVLRSGIRPFSPRCFLPLSLPLSPMVLAPSPVAPTSGGVRPTSFSNVHRGLSLERFFATSTAGAVSSSLTDDRFPKRRSGAKGAASDLQALMLGFSMIPGEPVPRSQRNEGSVGNEAKEAHHAKEGIYIGTFAKNFIFWILFFCSRK